MPAVPPRLKRWPAPAPRARVSARRARGWRGSWRARCASAASTPGPTRPRWWPARSRSPFAPASTFARRCSPACATARSRHLPGTRPRDRRRRRRRPQRDLAGLRPRPGPQPGRAVDRARGARARRWRGQRPLRGHPRRRRPRRCAPPRRGLRQRVPELALTAMVVTALRAFPSRPPAPRSIGPPLPPALAVRPRRCSGRSIRASRWVGSRFRPYTAPCGRT